MRLARSLIRLSVFIGLALFVADCSFGQVVIQERVEVDPAVAVEGPTSNMGALPGWQFNMPGRLVVDFNVIATDGLHCGSPLSIWNPRFEFRYSGSRDTVITVPLVPYIVNELNPPTSCDLWLIEFEGGFDLGLVADGDIVEVAYLAHGFEVPLESEVFVPSDTQNNGGGVYTWIASSYLETGNEPYHDHLFEGLVYTAVLEEAAAEAHHLYVTATPDSLLLDEVAVLSVEGRQDDETPVGLPAGATLDLNLDQGGGTVGFLRWNGVDDVVLTGVPAADIEAGLVEIVASETGPPALTGEAGADAFRQRHRFSDGREPAVNNMAGETTLTVTATLSNDPTITGSATVTVSVETPTLALAFALNGSPIDQAIYLPTKDDIIEVTATLIDGPPDATGDVTFTLPQDYEFEFDGAGSAPQIVALVNGEAKVSLKSLTWWGVALVHAEYDFEGLLLAKDQQIPVDSDGDTIADYWEMLPANGGRLDIAQDGINQDGMWDDEDQSMTTGNQNNGDSFSKLEEYQGVMRGGVHLRLLPTQKEVFFDVRGASSGVSVVAVVEQQLGLKVYDIDGVLGQGGGPLKIPTPGINALEFISPTTRFRASSGVVYVENATVMNPSPTNSMDITLNGLVIQQGNYIITGSSTPPPSYSVRFGVTQGTASGSGGVSRVYVGTVDNFWQNNSIPESRRTTFPYSQVVVTGGYSTWTAVYNNTDIDGNGNAVDPVNPFDLLSPSSTNDPKDFVVVTMTQQQFLDHITLHEVGHALGMSPNNAHPPNGVSAMRSGPGPASSFSFSAADVAQVKLK